MRIRDRMIVLAFSVFMATAIILMATAPESPGQTDLTNYYGQARAVTLRSASGALTAGETTTAVQHLQVFREAVVLINITTATLADGDDEVDFYLQTTYDGTNWTDLANVHLANADNGSPQKTVIEVGAIPAGVAQLDDPTDGAVADDQNVDYPLGSQLRIKTAVAGATAPTYAYSAVAILR